MKKTIIILVLWSIISCDYQPKTTVTTIYDIDSVKTDTLPVDTTKHDVSVTGSPYNLQP